VPTRHHFVCRSDATGSANHERCRGEGRTHDDWGQPRVILRQQWIVRCIASLLAVVALSGCSAATSTPIVYTAPPDVLNRTFPPLPSGSLAPDVSIGPDSSGAPSQAPEIPAGVPTPDATTPPIPASGAGEIGRPAPGQIIFGTGVGADSCSVANPTTVLSSSAPYYFAARLTDHQDGSLTIDLQIAKDGAPFSDLPQPPGGQPFDCVANTKSLGTLPAGAYRFQVVQGSTLEAAGSVTSR
jgi:hypothetical protein